MKAKTASRSWTKGGIGVATGLAHSRRVRVLALVLAFAAYALGGAAYAQKAKTPKGKFQTEKVARLQKTFEHGGVDRQYILHKPEGLPAKAPLLFVLHGRSGSNFWTYGLGFNDLADKNGFAVAYPQGEYRYMKGEDPNDPKAKGWTEWNAHMDPARVDDVGFLSGLASHIRALDTTARSVPIRINSSDGCPPWLLLSRKRPPRRSQQ